MKIPFFVLVFVILSTFTVRSMTLENKDYWQVSKWQTVTATEVVDKWRSDSILLRKWGETVKDQQTTGSIIDGNIRMSSLLCWQKVNTVLRTNIVLLQASRGYDLLIFYKFVNRTPGFRKQLLEEHNQLTREEDSF